MQYRDRRSGHREIFQRIGTQIWISDETQRPIQPLDMPALIQDQAHKAEKLAISIDNVVIVTAQEHLRRRRFVRNLKPPMLQQLNLLINCEKRFARCVHKNNSPFTLR